MLSPSPACVPPRERRSNEETNEPLLVDHRNFYKVEKWSRGGQRVERMLFRLQFESLRSAADTPVFAPLHYLCERRLLGCGWQLTFLTLAERAAMGLYYAQSGLGQSCGLA